MILSVIVISHNQREDLRRCLDSIIAQALPFEYEIIVSDDRSTDGSLELAQQYASDYAECQLIDGICRPRILAFACNSDECNPANNSQRSGYNRCNAYPHASGKYIAHVDADDYFRPGADVYRRQVEALEAHPECALAMSNCLCLDEGAPLADAHPWPFPKKMQAGEILSAEEFIRGDYFRLNQCFMQRRNPAVDPVALYGKRYVDSVITYHHLQFGNIIFVDACDYVYIGHSSSVVGQLAQQNHDSVVLWCLGLYIPLLIPRWSAPFMMGFYYQPIRDVLKLALSGYRLKPANYNSLHDFHAFIYDCFGREIHASDRFRLRFIDFWMKMMKVLGWESPVAIRILRKLLFA